MQFEIYKANPLAKQGEAFWFSRPIGDASPISQIPRSVFDTTRPFDGTFFLVEEGINPVNLTEIFQDRIGSFTQLRVSWEDEIVEFPSTSEAVLTLQGVIDFRLEELDGVVSLALYPRTTIEMIE